MQLQHLSSETSGQDIVNARDLIFDLVLNLNSLNDKKDEL